MTKHTKEEKKGFINSIINVDNNVFLGGVLLSIVAMDCVEHLANKQDNHDLAQIKETRELLYAIKDFNNNYENSDATTFLKSKEDKILKHSELKEMIVDFQDNNNYYLLKQSLEETSLKLNKKLKTNNSPS